MWGSLVPCSPQLERNLSSFQPSRSASQHNSIKCLRIQRGVDMSQHVCAPYSYLSVSAHICAACEQRGDNGEMKERRVKKRGRIWGMGAGVGLRGTRQA